MLAVSASTAESSPRTDTGTEADRRLVVGLPSNKGMNLTKREAFLAGGRALTSLRRSVFIEARFAGYARCSTNACGWTSGHN